LWVIKVNFYKSSLVSINLSEEEANNLAISLGCQTAPMLFTYLGLPMGTTKPTIQELSPLTNRVERMLTTSASFLSYGDRLILVNSVMSSLPIHYLCSLHIPDGAIDITDRARRHCLWRKRKDEDQPKSLAS
jgi:hypothetical protein